MVAETRKQLRSQPSGTDDGSVVILLIDDDPDCRMLIRDVIAECKVANKVVEFANGNEAMEYLRQRGKWKGAARPGLIYLDIEMPGLNGQATLKEIKADPKLREIPVVMMTGVCEEEQMHQAMANGANSYTLKPACAEDFLRTVLSSTNYWLRIHQYPEHHLPAEECLR
jgi:CheY-like chemotaxis protein